MRETQRKLDGTTLTDHSHLPSLGGGWGKRRLEIDAPAGTGKGGALPVFLHSEVQTPTNINMGTSGEASTHLPAFMQSQKTSALTQESCHSRDLLNEDQHYRRARSVSHKHNIAIKS